MYDFDISMINSGPNKIKWFGWTVCFYFSRLGHAIWYGCIWSIIDVKYRYGTAHLRYDTNTTRYLVCRFTTIRKQQIHRNTAILHISLILSPSFSITILWYHPDFESSFFCSMPHKPFFLWLPKIYVVCIIAVECILHYVYFRYLKRLGFEPNVKANGWTNYYRINKHTYVHISDHWTSQREQALSCSVEFQLFKRNFKINQPQKSISTIGKNKFLNSLASITSLYPNE